jgi:predicted metal-dependent enzyme (double-stranded beta helix superfamily)
MCDLHDHAFRASGEDEWFHDTPQLRAFIAEVRHQIGHASSPADACARIEPGFTELLADPDWLPAAFSCDAPESGMGGGIGQWLLFRSGDGSLALFSLVVPSGSQTPVHDHLAWGLIGLYRGAQGEDVYRLDEDGHARLAYSQAVAPGDFFALIPPEGDIHRVRTTSSETSVSIHLLTNDVGCIWRHRFDAESGEAAPFRSGYVNAPCDEAEGAAAGKEAVGAG